MYIHTTSLTLVYAPIRLTQIVKEQARRTWQETPTNQAESAKAFLYRRSPFGGGARRDRTVDLLLAKQALSQLSYSPGVGDGGSGRI